MAIVKRRIGGIEWMATGAGPSRWLEAEVTEAQHAVLADVIAHARMDGWDVTEVRGTDDPEMCDPGKVWVCMRPPQSALAGVDAAVEMVP